MQNDPIYLKLPNDKVDRACEMKKEVLAGIEKLGEILPANTLGQASVVYTQH